MDPPTHGYGAASTNAHEAWWTGIVFIHLWKSAAKDICEKFVSAGSRNRQASGLCSPEHFELVSIGVHSWLRLQKSCRF